MANDRSVRAVALEIRASVGSPPFIGHAGVNRTGRKTASAIEGGWRLSEPKPQPHSGSGAPLRIASATQPQQVRNPFSPICCRWSIRRLCGKATGVALYHAPAAGRTAALALTERGGWGRRSRFAARRPGDEIGLHNSGRRRLRRHRSGGGSKRIGDSRNRASSFRIRSCH